MKRELKRKMKLKPCHRKAGKLSPSNAFKPSGRYIMPGLGLGSETPQKSIRSDMPIYEYRCVQCGHELEKIQRMSEEPLKDCPACEKPQLRRLISASAFRLKGGGWYETDFKHGSKRNLADSGNDAPKESAGSEKSDSKSDTAKTGGKESSQAETGKKESKPVKESKNSAA